MNITRASKPKLLRSKPIRKVFPLFLLILLILPAIGGRAIHVYASTTDTVVVVGAGDISSCSTNNDTKTANLLGNISGTVLALGDNAYENGTLTEYNNCYGPTWGVYKSRTKPVPGNHEYQTSGAAGYFNYFGVPKYYAYNLGAWRVYALNSEIGVSSTTTQAAWLKNDLAANPKKCILAYWHRPRWSSTGAADSGMQTIWSILVDAKAEVVLSGHAHNYERFAQMNKSGQAVSAGLRQFVVGTGGSGHSGFGAILPSSRAHNASTYGVLKLTLRPDGYDWKFIPIAGQTYTDSGSTSCY
jgi:hypothetical protein